MAYTDIDKSDDYFNTVLYTGNGGTQSITGVNFQPDWVWCKARTGTAYHHLECDAVRGATKYLLPSATTAEVTDATTITSFNSDGFTTGSSVATNGSGASFVSWNWLAGNGTASNTDGSITSTVSANTTSGFSIVKFTGTGSAATVGHGLGVAPDWYLVKRYNGGDGGQWNAYHSSLGATKFMLLNSTSASQTSGTRWNNTEPTSSVFTVNTSGDVNDSGDLHVAYCFAEKKGFSKFGSYTGNGSTNGTFVYTGFKTAFVMVKRTNSTGSWRMWDNKREGYNGDNAFLYANSTSTEEADGTVIDLLSNGFKFRNSSGDNNASGSSYIYLAFAENPFVTSTGIAGTAR